MTFTIPIIIVVSIIASVWLTKIAISYVYIRLLKRIKKNEAAIKAISSSIDIKVKYENIHQLHGPYSATSGDADEFIRFGGGDNSSSVGDSNV